MSAQTSRDDQPSRGSTDREMWSHDIAWLLNDSEAALGHRGTTGSVISVIEHGGGVGCSSSDPFHDAMITRLGRGSPVRRARELGKRWHALQAKHRRTLLAHYVGFGRASSTVQGAVGLAAGVVVEQWLTASSTRRARAAAELSSGAADALELVYEEIAPLEPLLARARHAFTPGDPNADGTPKTPKERRRERLRARAALQLVGSALRRLHAKRDALLSAHATAPAASTLEQELLALENACRSGKGAALRARAERDVREAHRAWARVGQKEIAAQLEP